MLQEQDEAARGLSLAGSYPKFSNIKTMQVWAPLAKDYSIEPGVNEWYLFHGTSQEAAAVICSKDFKINLAGDNTGTLYGRGSYFAESITKADEYARNDGSGV